MPEDIYWSFILAVAHHHTPRAKQYPKVDLIDKFRDILSSIDTLDIDNNLIISNFYGGEIPKTMVDLIIKNKYYRFYSFVSKILRLSDWVATSGEKI